AFDTADEVSDTAHGGANPWMNWFGTAYYQVMWDASDASNNLSSGSLLIQAFYPDSGIGGCCGPQFVAMNGYGGITPPLTGNGGPPSSGLATNVEFDLRFDPGSMTDAGPNWPTIEVGTRGGGFNQYDFGTVSVPVAQTNWVHVVIPIGPSANWVTIPNIFFKHYSTALAGWVRFYVDNIRFTTAPVPIVPPTMSIQKPVRALRVFAGSTVNIYDREHLTAIDTNQSWV